MLTPDVLHAMEPAERAELFDTLALRHFGHGWQAKAAYAFGVNRATVGRWLHQGTVPFAVILLLQAWRKPGATAEWRAIAASLGDVTARLEALANERDGRQGGGVHPG